MAKIIAIWFGKTEGNADDKHLAFYCIHANYCGVGGRGKDDAIWWFGKIEENIDDKHLPFYLYTS
jgi:hypothetical protein